jgi:hypothetical protein
MQWPERHFEHLARPIALGSLSRIYYTKFGIGIQWAVFHLFKSPAPAPWGFTIYD